ncbi:hypothetical protein LTR53_019663, partial [Teratosphaeriaceae sp. CCFEE 6253]
EEVVRRVVEELQELRREQGLPRKGRRVVVLGGQEDDEEEAQIALREVEGLRVPALVEGDGGVRDAVLLLELADEAGRGVAGVKWPAAGVAGRGRGAAGAEPGEEAREEREEVAEGAEEALEEG